MKKKNFILFNNQKSGNRENKEKTINEIINLFKKNNIQIEIFNSQYPRHIEEHIKNCDLENIDGIIGLGGDGTFNEMINGLHRREKKSNIPVGLIPLGTGNDFIRSLGPINPFFWAKKIVDGKTQKIDVIKIETKERELFGQLLIGWGVFHDAALASEKYRFFGPFKYTLGSLEALLRSKLRTSTIKFNDQEFKGQFWGALICNTKFIGGGLLMARDAKINDGLFEFFIIKNISRFLLIILFIQLALKIPLSPKLVSLYKLEKVEINPEILESINIDGEIIGESNFKAKILPQSYNLFS